MVSLTRRSVRTSMRRTLSSNSAMVMTARGRKPKTENRDPKSEGRSKTEIRTGQSAAASCLPLFRVSGFGFPSEFGFRISDLPSWHRHGVEDLLDNGIGRHRLRLGFIGEDEAMTQHVGADALDVFRRSEEHT